MTNPRAATLYWRGVDVLKLPDNPDILTQQPMYPHYQWQVCRKCRQIGSSLSTFRSCGRRQPSSSVAQSHIKTLTSGDYAPYAFRGLIWAR